MSAEEEVPSLFERISGPTVPKEAKRKIDLLEQEFQRAKLEQLRKQIPIFRPLYAKRNALITSSALQEADFWPRVFSSAPGEIAYYIQPSDTAVIGQCLKNLTVEHFDVDENGNGGDPRSVRFTFDFVTGDENPYFTDAQLVKEFYYRTKISRTAKGRRDVWEGYVSEPVRIHWKEGQDLTKGLLDAACDLYEAEQKDKSRKRTELPEYKKLDALLSNLEAETKKNRLEDDEEADNDDDDDDEDDEDGALEVSFFTWFGYRGNDVTAEESTEAAKEEFERWQKIENGEQVDDDDDGDEEVDELDEVEDYARLNDVEVFPVGEEMVEALAENLWPNAIEYYLSSYDDEDDFDELDIDELDELEDDDGEGEGEGESEDQEDDDGRPAKKVKT